MPKRMSIKRSGAGPRCSATARSGACEFAGWHRCCCFLTAWDVVEAGCRSCSLSAVCVLVCVCLTSPPVLYLTTLPA